MKKCKDWQGWAVGTVIGVLMLLEGTLCSWPHGPAPFHQPPLAFGCLLGGGLLLLLAIHPLHREWRRRRQQATTPSAVHAPLPSPFQEAAALARRRPEGQGADEVCGWVESSGLVGRSIDIPDRKAGADTDDSNP